MVSVILAIYKMPNISRNFEKRRMVIAIDVGHTRAQPGATSSRGNTEFSFNYKVATMLVENLKKRGFFKSFLINQNGEINDLAERTGIANERNAKLLISVHHDSVQPKYLSNWQFDGKQYFHCDLFRGFSIFYSEKNPYASISLAFAETLGRQLISNGFIPSLHHSEPIEGENRELIDHQKGIFRVDDFVITKTAIMPAVLLECGIIVNRNEEILLLNEVYIRILVLSIADAIEKSLLSNCVAKFDKNKIGLWT